MAPTFYGAQDIQAMLDTFGVSVVVGAVTAKGIRDIVDERALEEQAYASGGEVTVLVKTGTFTLSIGGDITVEGTAYKIVAADQVEDGGLTRVVCATS